MNIPKCYDPAQQAADREAKWDRYLASLPRCNRCGKEITGPKLVYIKSHDEYYCLDCIDAMTEFNEAAEVE
jgi:hypothetical protein